MAKSKVAEAPSMADFPESIHLSLKLKKHKPPKVEPGEKITVSVTGKVTSFSLDEERFSVGLEISGVEFSDGRGSLSSMVRDKQQKHRRG